MHQRTPDLPLLAQAPTVRRPRTGASVSRQTIMTLFLALPIVCSAGALRAGDPDPGGTMDPPGLKMFICNYLANCDGRTEIVGRGKTVFRGQDTITLVLSSCLLCKKRGYIEVLGPHGRKIKSFGYDFKKTWGWEMMWLRLSAPELRERYGPGTYAARFYFNKQYKKLIDFEIR